MNFACFRAILYFYNSFNKAMICRIANILRSNLMKKQLKTLTKVKGVGAIKTPENNPLLLHFLSPLERSAYQRKFKKFIYDLDGLEIEIEAHMSRALYYRSRKHVWDMRDLLQGKRIQLLKRSDEHIRRFSPVSRT